jgi:N-acetylglucosamine-6-phosphate deacetylase
MTFTLRNATVVTPLQAIDPGDVVVGNDGTIIYCGPSGSAPPERDEVHSLEGHIVTPGLIDIHTHGGHSVTFGQSDALLEDLRTYAAWATTTGVTGFLCSVAAPDPVALRALVEAYAGILGDEDFEGAQPLGLHLEGPYLNPEQKGAFNPAWLRRPLIEEVQDLLTVGQGWIRQMTLAPELPESHEVAALLRQAGVVASLGHSNTDYATAADALMRSFGHVTHTFNAQRGFHHREPGVLGAVLSSDNVSAELIADTVHVHPGAMKVMLRCLGTGRVVLITDAMAAAGLGDGTYELVGQQVFVRDGVARLSTGTIAGSTATLNQCVRNMVMSVGVSLTEAVTMASLNPARVLGMDDRAGLLTPGRPATLTVLDPDFNVVMTLVDGHVVYRQ